VKNRQKCEVCKRILGRTDGRRLAYPLLSAVDNCALQLQVDYMKKPLMSLSVEQLTRAIAIREKIDLLGAELHQLLGGSGPAPVKGRRKMSAAGRAAIAAGARKRWAKVKGQGAAQPRRKMNAAARAKIAAAARARWKAAKAAGKTRL
jgi:hypothetical protein